MSVHLRELLETSDTACAIQINGVQNCPAAPRCHCFQRDCMS